MTNSAPDQSVMTATSKRRRFRMLYVFVAFGLLLYLWIELNKHVNFPQSPPSPEDLQEASSLDEKRAFFSDSTILSQHGSVSYYTPDGRLFHWYLNNPRLLQVGRWDVRNHYYFFWTAGRAHLWRRAILCRAFDPKAMGSDSFCGMLSAAKPVYDDAYVRKGDVFGLMKTSPGPRENTRIAPAVNWPRNEKPTFELLMQRLRESSGEQR